MKEEKEILDYKLEEGAREFDYLDEKEDLEETKEFNLEELKKIMGEDDE